MAEFLYKIDVSIFYFINKTLATGTTDRFFSFITELNHWIIFFAIMWLYLVIAGGRRGRITAIMLLFLIFTSDQLSSNLIKHLVERIRPCNALAGVNVLVSCTKSFSFPSSHAVNYFAAAVFLSHLYPRFTFAYYTVASLEGLSRIFCGVHYPSDVLAGTIIGVFIGWVYVQVWKEFNKRVKFLKE